MRIALSALLLALGFFGASAAESDFLSNVRQLTFEGKSGEGYFSPDGKNLIFQSVREPGNPFYQIYLLDLETGDTHRVSPGAGKTTCSFFRPGSDEVLFASTHLDPDTKHKQDEEIAFLASGKTRRYSWDYDPAMDIFSAKRDGSNLRRLTDAAGYDAEAAYSPDGKQIVFTSLRSAFETASPADKARYEKDPAYFADIYLMNADGSGQKRLTTSPGYDGGPFFMPDGKRIVWRRFDTNGVIADVFTMNLDGGDVRQVTRFESMSWAPYPHPSGKYFIFTSNKHGFENFELFIVDAEGRGQPVRVTFTDDFDGLPVFSPDGQKLCWTSQRKGKPSQLFLAEWNHSAALNALGSVSERHERGRAPATNATSTLSPDIRAEDARQYVEYLASDNLEGRKTGEPGAAKAAEYIAHQLTAFGIPPLQHNGAGTNAYFEAYDFPAGVLLKTNGTTLTVKSAGSEHSFGVNEQFRPLAFSSNGDAEGAVVFAGYGLSVPGGEGQAYNSYDGLNLTNKIALLLRYVPENVDPKRRSDLNRYAALRYKAMIAREHGAKAILIVEGPNSPKPGQLLSLGGDGTLAGSEILALSVSLEVAEKLLAPSGRNLKDLQTALDSENPHAEKSFEVQNVTVHVTVNLEHQRKSDRNVIGVVSGMSGEFVMVGAHFDHLGHGDGADSRQTSDEQGQIHHGADDNASGVSAVLELASAWAKAQKPKRGILFAFWSGEEMGLLGSSYFVEHSPLPLTNIVAYLNFDMVGRVATNRVIIQGAGSSSYWKKEIERRNIPAGFDIVLQDDPYLPSDSTAFYPKGIPILAFFTGSHDDYHRPSDTADKLNYPGIERVTKLANSILRDLASAETRPDYLKVDRTSAPGNRDALRVYLGTVPDYATEVKGVKLSGVRGGSPAEKGGLKGGDIITEFAGQKIANIYDYTYALDAAKIGQPLKIVVNRDGRDVEVTVTPEARK